jgi:ribokinase
MDLFYRVRALPKRGEKQYFADERILSDAIVGGTEGEGEGRREGRRHENRTLALVPGRICAGVTLNHLSWAALLGAPTGLMALQGMDPHGVAIRGRLRELGVSTDAIRVSSAYTTSVSHVFIDEEGERSIIMAPASTSTITGDAVERLFAPTIESGASLVTTEISQVPLSGVEALLSSAARRGVPSLLDVDVSPKVAEGPARLGDRESLRRCVQAASVVKLTRSAAEELLDLGRPGVPLASTLGGVAEQLGRAFGSALCVVTDGARGSALSARGGAVVEVEAVPNVTQIDATGAGDAFFGGIVASCHAWGLPSSHSDLERAGRVASAAGAACCGVLGALPVPEQSVPMLREYEPLVEELLAMAQARREIKSTSEFIAPEQPRKSTSTPGSTSSSTLPSAPSSPTSSSSSSSSSPSPSLPSPLASAVRTGGKKMLALFESMYADVETSIGVRSEEHTSELQSQRG